MTYDLDDPEVCGRIFDRLKKEQTLVSSDPVRIRVTVTYDGSERYLTLDENLTVVDVAGDDHRTDRGSAIDTSERLGSGTSPDAPSSGKETCDESVSLPETEDCLQTLRHSRWPDGIRCPNCEGTAIIKKGTTSKDAQRYKCQTCTRKFNDLTGTIFADHQLSIPEMFHIIREMNATEITQVARQLDRSYKAVLELAHEARDSSTSSESAVVAAVTPPN
jgi:transposase-like protein